MLVKEHSAKAAEDNKASKSLPLPRTASTKSTFRAIKMKLEGAGSWTGATGLEPTGGVSNYFIGNDSKSWRTNIPQYARIGVPGVYEGIDLIFYNHGGDLEYDFVVRPGANPNKIQLAFEGQDQLRVDRKSGDLILTSGAGSEVRQVR